MSRGEIPSWEEMDDEQRKEETRRFCRLLKNKPKQFLEWAKGKRFGTQHKKIHEANNRRQ